MTTTQKIIKNLALALAIFLIVSIITGVLSLISSIAFDDEDDVVEENKMTTINTDNSIDSLNIKINYANLIVKTGDTFLAKTNNKNISISEENGILNIKEKKNNWYKRKSRGELILYLPEDLELKDTKIVAGAGKIDIDKLNTKKLDFELGAGKTTVNNLIASSNADIESGAGELNIKTGSINNLNLDMGVGKIELTSVFTGKSEIDAGIGELNLNVLGNKEDYTLKVDKGIGSIKVDNENTEDNSTIGDGFNIIDIDGGIGSINLNFKSNIA